jgi:DNA-binding HxlR family transcriptional regulator
MYSIDMKTTDAGQTIGCVDSATAILGNKWTPQLLRYFINEDSVRFCQIQDLVGGINPRTLCARLEQLEDAGIIVKTQTSEGSRCVYQLTDKGHDLLPVLQTMQEWSTKYPALQIN